MGQVVQFPRGRATGPSASNQQASLELGAANVDTAMWPVGGLLFVASVLRVAHALYRGETFDAEPTAALFLALLLPWLALRSRGKGARNHGPVP